MNLLYFCLCLLNFAQQACLTLCICLPVSSLSQDTYISLLHDMNFWILELGPFQIQKMSSL